jgi:hypothetical protein
MVIATQCRASCPQHEEFEDLDEWKFGRDDEELSNLLQTSDNFVVAVAKGNAEGVQFYILQCQQPKFMVCEAFQCVWGGDFDVGNFVVVQHAKTYYQKWGRSSRNYVFFTQSRVAYIDAHLVKIVKFPMTQRDHHVKGDDLVYKLSLEN